MLSRVADSLYWMSRYMERADNTARLLDVNLHLLSDFKDLNDARLIEHWEPIIQSTGDWDLFRDLYSVADSYSVTDFLTFNRSNPNSILSCLSAARNNARMIRDQISSEMWEAINRTYLKILSSTTGGVWRRGPSEFYQEIRDDSHLFQGLTESTFVHDEGFFFMQLGTYLERGAKTSRILDIKYHILLPALEAFHRAYVANVSPARVAEFLILSDSFPRSIRHCAGEVDEYLHRVAGSERGRYFNEAERLSGKLYYDLTFLRITEVLNYGMHQYLDYIQVRFNELGKCIAQTYGYGDPEEGSGAG